MEIPEGKETLLASAFIPQIESNLRFEYTYVIGQPVSQHGPMAGS